MNIIISGAAGRMGKELARLASESYRNANAVAGFDIAPVTDNAFPIYSDWNAVGEKADCIVDFSHHAATHALLEYAVKTNTPVVLATTGHTEEELAEIREAAEKIPVFHSANMSLGIALLAELAKMTAKAMPDADIEIVEKHHNRKLDSPSGTALLLANAIRSVRNAATFMFSRNGNARRTKEEIGIHAIRMGNIVGEHEIIVGTDTQTITLKHEAHSRSLFAEGSLAAAEFLVGKPAGLYDMNRMVRGE